MAVRCLVSKSALNSFIDMVRSSCVVVFMKVNELINNGSGKQKYKLGTERTTSVNLLLTYTARLQSYTHFPGSKLMEHNGT